MTIWVLALVLIASVAALGYRQGAIRVACSTVGLFIGLLFAGLLAKPIKMLLVVVFGLKTPPTAWLLAPAIVVVLFSIIAKVVAFNVHRKIDVHYRYRAGDLRLALWERLNHRLGACLGLLNGVLYFLLISFAIYEFGYWAVQIASSDTDPKSIRLLARMGRDMDSTGFSKAACAIDPMPRAWYDAADLAGLLYHNPLLEARLCRYPAFLGLGEKGEFQDLGSDKQFTDMRQRGEAIMELLDLPRVQAITQNPELLQTIWTTLVPDMADLRGFLESGKSAKYDSEPILGRWNFDLSSTMIGVRRARPNMSSTEMQRIKRWMASAFSRTSFVAMTDHQVLLKNLPNLAPPPPAPAGAPPAPAPAGTQNVQGQWRSGDGKYQLSFGGQDVQLSLNGDRMAFRREGLELAFTREI